MPVFGTFVKYQFQRTYDAILAAPADTEELVTQAASRRTDGGSYAASSSAGSPTSIGFEIGSRLHSYQPPS